VCSSDLSRMFDRIVEQAAHYLITFSLGTNQELEDHVKERGAQGFTCQYVKREGEFSMEWKRIPGITYDFPEGFDCYLGSVFFFTNVEL